MTETAIDGQWFADKEEEELEAEAVVVKLELEGQAWHYDIRLGHCSAKHGL